MFWHRSQQNKADWLDVHRMHVDTDCLPFLKKQRFLTLSVCPRRSQTRPCAHRLTRRTWGTRAFFSKIINY
jgi:hypothetical protein